jgi:hypothetical protein
MKRQIELLLRLAGAWEWEITEAPHIHEIVIRTKGIGMGKRLALAELCSSMFTGLWSYRVERLE